MPFVVRPLVAVLAGFSATTGPGRAAVGDSANPNQALIAATTIKPSAARERQLGSL